MKSVNFFLFFGGIVFVLGKIVIISGGEIDVIGLYISNRRKCVEEGIDLGKNILN